MNTNGEVLNEVVEKITSAGDDDHVCVDDLLDSFGERSFGPLLLVPSLIAVSPLSSVPTVPTISGITIALIAGQLLMGRSSFWLPGKLRRRCISRKRMESAVSPLRPLAAAVDKIVRPRAIFLTQKPFTQVIAAICLLIALMMPVMEAVPFSIHVAGAVVALFAIALTAHDGFLAIAAFSFTAMMAFFGIGALVEE